MRVRVRVRVKVRVRVRVRVKVRVRVGVGVGARVEEGYPPSNAFFTGTICVLDFQKGLGFRVKR